MTFRFHPFFWAVLANYHIAAGQEGEILFHLLDYSLVLL